MIQCSIFILITEIPRHNPIISKEVFLNELSFYWSENSVFSLKIWLHTLFFWIKLTKFYLNFTNRTGGAWWAAVHAVAKSRTRLSDFTFTFHFHALEKEMATHSSVLAWRIPGTGEPGGLPSMGSHRVRHDWSYTAAAAATEPYKLLKQKKAKQ